MRISDWSSDVCSSDLSPSAWASRRWLSLCRPDRSESVQNRPQSERLQNQVVAGADPGEWAFEWGHFWGHQRQGHIAKIHWNQASAGAFRILVGPARSEEHTSELQSLMRISYAVFCLKKK